jgi:aspartate carbamoyltransferase catalytic subunit
LLLLRTLGADVHFVAPPTLLPANTNNFDASFHYSLDDVIDSEKPDVIMMLRIQQERMSASYFPTQREYSKFWGMNIDRMNRMKSGAIIMHPGPMNRGLEIDAASADSPRSTVLEQVANGVSVRMAVLYSLLSADKE